LRGETPPEMDFVTDVMGGEQWVRVAAVPLLRGEDVSGAVIVAEDITERKRAEQHIRLLLREVSHRSKNMLSVVQAVARHTAASNPDDFIRYFEERVRALSAGQDLLVKSEWRGADLEDLVRAQLAHFENLLDVRIRLRGPALLISAPASQTLGMALHELGTNSGKYGALSTDTGQVDVVWDVTRAETAEQQFMIAWIEHGGPRVEKPSRRGFGSTVLCDVAGTMLGAAVALEYPPAGLTWRLDCPAKNVLEPAAPGMGHWP
jgi:two-component sensor histidine kinase